RPVHLFRSSLGRPPTSTLFPYTTLFRSAVVSGAVGEGVYISEEWQTARSVSGHHVHVVPEGVACTECHELTDTEIGAVVPSKCAKMPCPGVADRACTSARQAALRTELHRGLHPVSCLHDQAALQWQGRGCTGHHRDRGLREVSSLPAG